MSVLEMNMPRPVGVAVRIPGGREDEEFGEVTLAMFRHADMICVYEAEMGEVTGEIRASYVRTGRAVTEEDMPTRARFRDWQYHDCLGDGLERLFALPCGGVDEVLALRAQAVMCRKAAEFLSSQTTEAGSQTAGS